MTASNYLSTLPVDTRGNHPVPTLPAPTLPVDTRGNHPVPTLPARTLPVDIRRNHPAPTLPVDTRANHQTPRVPVEGAAGAPRGLTINIVAAVVLALSILLGFVTFAGDAAATSPVDPAAPTVAPDTIEIYIVQPGDTLWSIAASIALPDEDPRPLVDALNDLAGGASLEIGDRLIIDHTTLRG